MAEAMTVRHITPTFPSEEARVRTEAETAGLLFEILSKYAAR